MKLVFGCFWMLSAWLCKGSQLGKWIPDISDVGSSRCVQCCNFSNNYGIYEPKKTWGIYPVLALDVGTVQHQLYHNLASNGNMHTSLLVTDKYVYVFFSRLTSCLAFSLLSWPSWGHNLFCWTHTLWLYNIAMEYCPLIHMIKMLIYPRVN